MAHKDHSCLRSMHAHSGNYGAVQMGQVTAILWQTWAPLGCGTAIRAKRDLSKLQPASMAVVCTFSVKAAVVTVTMTGRCTKDHSGIDTCA